MRTRTIAGHALVALALAACSGGSTSESVAVTPERAPTPPRGSTLEVAPDTPPPEPPPPVEADPTATRATVDIDARTLARRWIREHEHDRIELDGHCVTVAPAYPSALRTRIETLLTSTAQEICAGFPDAARWNEGIDIANVLATPSLLSVTWRATWPLDMRSGLVRMAGASRHYRIADGELRPFELDEALRMDVVDRVVTARCSEWLAADAAANADDPYYELLGASCGARAWVELEARAVVVALEIAGGTPVEAFRVPYSELEGAIIEGGPIAQMLRIGGASATPTAEASADAWAVSGLAPLSELALAWAALPAASRRAVRLASDDGQQGRLVLSPDADEEPRNAIARALGATPARAPWPEQPIELAIVRTRTSLNLRAEPRGTLLRAVPVGTVAIAVAAAQSEGSPWSRLVVAPMLVGWGSARLVEPTDCMPSIDAHVAALPAAERDAARAATWRIETHAVASGRVVDAALFVTGTTDDAGQPRTRIALRRLSGACRVGTELGAWSLSSEVRDVQATRTERAGGEVLILADVRREWVALRVGTSEPVWRTYAMRVSDASGVLAPGTHGPHGRGFWPLVTRLRGEVHAFRWDGATLVPDDAPPTAQTP